MIFFLGFLGTFLAIICFIMGFSLGRRFPEKLAPIEPTPELKRQQEEEAQAFRQLFGYSETVAYGSAGGGNAT